MRSPRATIAARAACTLAACALSACSSDPRTGYTFKGVHSENIRTVSVPVFDNRTYSTGLEVELTEAVIKEIQRTTRWSVTSSGAADVTLSGTVQSSELRRLSVEPVTGLAQEMGVDVRVDFELRDNRSGKVITARKNFGVTDTFVATRNTGERIEIGRSATVSTMARDIVAELSEDW